MSEFVRLLATIGRINPAAWDAIIPHGPAVRIRSRGAEVALNPQPLPPAELFLVGAAEVAHDVVRLALDLDVRDDRGSALINQVTDEWCGTPWPRKWPWPWPGPRPNWDDVLGPRPEPWTINAARVIAAVVFASYASRLAEGELSTALEGAAEQLAKAGLEQ